MYLWDNFWLFSVWDLVINYYSNYNTESYELKCKYGLILLSIPPAVGKNK